MRPLSYRKKEFIMAALARPKESSYIIKKDCAAKIVESKNTPAFNARMMERASIFQMNNLRKAPK